MLHELLGLFQQLNFIEGFWTKIVKFFKNLFGMNESIKKNKDNLTRRREICKMSRIVTLQSSIYEGLSKFNFERYLKDVNQFITVKNQKKKCFSSELTFKNHRNIWLKIFAKTDFDAIMIKRGLTKLNLKDILEEVYTSMNKLNSFTIQFPDTNDYVVEYKQNYLKMVDSLPDTLFVDYKKAIPKIKSLNPNLITYITASIKDLKDLMISSFKKIEDVSNVPIIALKENFIEQGIKFVIESEYNTKYKVFSDEGEVDLVKLRKYLLYGRINSLLEWPSTKYPLNVVKLKQSLLLI